MAKTCTAPDEKGKRWGGGDKLPEIVQVVFTKWHVIASNIVTFNIHVRLHKEMTIMITY